jgi:excisionase family DNA binding protein
MNRVDAEVTNSESFLSVEDVAQRLGVAHSWVYSAAERGKLPAIKVGKYLRFDPVELRAWLTEHRYQRRTLPIKHGKPSRA